MTPLTIFVGVVKVTAGAAMSRLYEDKVRSKVRPVLIIGHDKCIAISRVDATLLYKKKLRTNEDQKHRT